LAQKSIKKEEATRIRKIGFIGATPNFFKLGFTTMQHIMNVDEESRPLMALGLPEEVTSVPEIVKHLT